MSIKFRNVSMEYKKGIYALNGINLEVNKGMFGLLGQNGAGKTTLIRILITLLKPSSGQVYINNILVEPKKYMEIKSMVGYLPQEFGFYPNLSVFEAMDFIGILNKIHPNERKKIISSLLDKVNLKNEAHKKVKHLSGGMKRRLGLAQAMINSPQILIVDEPTAGLDPEERIRIRNILNEFGRDRTIILSTHIVEDIASTCKQLAIMDKGTIKYSGSVKELIQNAEGNVWKCIVKTNEELENIKCRYTVLSNIYMQDYIEIRLLNSSKPQNNAELLNPSIEDAYMLLAKKEA